MKLSRKCAIGQRGSPVPVGSLPCPLAIGGTLGNLPLGNKRLVAQHLQRFYGRTICPLKCGPAYA
jgi:hypothetical protein